MHKEKKLSANLSAENIERLAKTEGEFQKLKDNRAEDYQSIQEKKLDQYATLISHIKPIWKSNKTDSNNLGRQDGIDMRTDLITDVGMSQSNAKVLYEKSVQFVAKFEDEIPTQATPDSVLQVFAQKSIKSQNDLKKSVSEEKDQDLAEQISRKLFGKTKIQKVKQEDGTTIEEEVYIPTDLDADKVQKVWEVLQDKRRERLAHDTASADAQKKTSEDNDIANRIDQALAS